MTHPMTRTVILLGALVAAVALFAATFAAKPAGAIVPPKNCGKVTVKGKVYNIKSDQLRCKRARRYSVRYLKYRTHPDAYKCYSYPGSSIKFRCVAARYNPDKTYYAIKR
jgi:hypothetical protein